MKLRQNTNVTKCKCDKCKWDKMQKIPNINNPKLIRDKMQIWQNANVTKGQKQTKCKPDKMQTGQNAKETKCNCNKIQIRHNVILSKCKWDIMPM